MPWRAGWWCGCDGSGVRWRRATGRRGWRGGGGCGCNSSPIGRWRSRGRRGPSRGRRTRGACGPPGALLPGAQVAAGSSRDPPGARVEAADPFSIPGRRPTPISWRAGGTGRRESRGRGRSCTPTRSGRCTPGANPAAPPLRSSMHSADQRQGRSHCAAIEPADALHPISPPAPRPARPPRHRLPGAPGRVAGPRAAPRRVPGLAPAPSPTRSKHPPGRSRTGQGAPAPTDPTSSELIGVLPGRGHDSSSLHGTQALPPHPGRSSLEPRTRLARPGPEQTAEDARPARSGSARTSRISVDTAHWFVAGHRGSTSW